MLREDVVDAIQGGDFHIYAVRTIDEGMETLTGIEAGERASGSGYPEGSVNWRVQKRLTELAVVFKNFYTRRSLRHFQPIAENPFQASLGSSWFIR